MYIHMFICKCAYYTCIYVCGEVWLALTSAKLVVDSFLRIWVLFCLSVAVSPLLLATALTLLSLHHECRCSKRLWHIKLQLERERETMKGLLRTFTEFAYAAFTHTKDTRAHANHFDVFYMNFDIRVSFSGGFSFFSFQWSRQLAGRTTTTSASTTLPTEFEWNSCNVLI